MSIQITKWTGQAAFALAALVATSALAPAAFAHRVEKRFPVEMHPTVTIRNKSGKVSIKSWKKQEILVVATHVSEKTEVDATQMGNRVEIVTHLLTEEIAPAELEANYEITVPEETAIQLRNDSGDVFVERISGDMSVDTVGAGVDLKEVAGYLVIKTVGGSLTCYLCAGRIEVNTISGDLKFLRPLSNNVRAQSYSGSILFDGAFERGGTYVLKNFTGPIEVRFSEGDSFVLNASSEKGKVESQASLKPPAHLNSYQTPKESRSILSGTQNLGLARVDLTSYSGTIKVLKRQ
ncbi:MAG: DUF4097 family beta strand repeat protein [Acidobacteria bacterium]|nr:DUF4097 family beta strand repeat protein [Acidobacteriota bacterium]